MNEFYEKIEKSVKGNKQENYKQRILRLLEEYQGESDFEVS